MPMEHDAPQPGHGVNAPNWTGRVMVLAGAGLTTFSLVRDEGDAGALTAVGAAGLGLGLGYLVRRTRK